MSVVFPPVEADFLCLVDRADDQADADGQELHFRQRDLDVTRDRQPLVEDAIKDVDEATDAVTVGRRRKVFHHRRRTKYGTNARTGKREIDVSGALIGKMFPTASGKSIAPLVCLVRSWSWPALRSTSRAPSSFPSPSPSPATGRLTCAPSVQTARSMIW